MSKKIVGFIKREIVFSIALLLAIISAFIVPPSKEYIGYINFQTLALLLALMLVVQGLNSCGLFDKLVELSMKRISDLRQMTLLMITLCFFSSMFITNDVALITFVPFTIILLDVVEDSKFSIIIIILETMAANLGSMFTPIGNPQNLYLYSVSKYTLFGFLKIMLPYTVLSFAMLAITSLFVKKKPLNEAGKINTKENKLNKSKLLCFIGMFVVCIFTVLGVLDYRIMLALVIFAVLLIDKSLVLKADYILLLTFVAFFVFIGNMKNMEAVSTFLSGIVKGRECVIATVTSQFVSNVPAAVLLAGFTNKYKDLIIGTNFGGLGTLIASMASLISYKFYVKSKDSNVARYVLVFTGLSIIYLAILLVAYFIIE